jgi:tetratricopeptide (TPR) repeat protein
VGAFVTVSSSANPFSNLRHVPLIGLVLVLGTWAIYWPVSTFEFVSYDDPRYVPENGIVQAGLTWAGFKWAFSNISVGHWHPLTWLSHMLVCQFFGADPRWHHLANLFLHSLNALLFFLVLRRLTGAVTCSAFAAALFAWHPLRVESVAWVAEHKDVLAGFFWLLTIWAYVRYTERPGALRYVMILVLFTVGLLCKAILITLPFVLLLLDFWPLRRARPGASRPPNPLNSDAPPTPGRGPENGKSWGALILEKLPLFGLVLVSCVTTFLAGRGAGAFIELPLWARIGNVPIAFVRYLGKFLWPTDLAVLYPHPGRWPWWQVIGATGILILLSASFLRLVHKRPYLMVGWLWFLGVLVPVIGLVQVGEQSMADRYTYIPMLGLTVMVTWGMADLARHFPFGRGGLAAAGVGVLVVMALGTRAQLRHWQDSVALFRHAVHVTTRNATAHYNLGQALSVRGNVGEAMPHYEAALAIDPDYDAARNNLGLCYATMGQFETATNHYAAALRSNPKNAHAYYNFARALTSLNKPEEAIAYYKETLRVRPEHVWAHFWFANSLAAQGQLEEALSQYSQTLRLNPQCQEAHYEMGLVLAKQGKTGPAASHLRRAIELKPDHADSHIHLGSALADQRQPKDAMTQYRLALRLNPNAIDALNNLAWMLATQPDAELRNGTEAVQLAERACEITSYQVPLLVGTLAAACAEAGRFADAVKFAQKAEDLALALDQKELAARNKKLQLLYQTQKPYREE